MVPKLVWDTQRCLPLQFYSLLVFWTHECVLQQPSVVGLCHQGRSGQGLTSTSIKRCLCCVWHAVSPVRINFCPPFTPLLLWPLSALTIYGGNMYLMGLGDDGQEQRTRAGLPLVWIIHMGHRWGRILCGGGDRRAGVPGGRKRIIILFSVIESYHLRKQWLSELLVKSPCSCPVGLLMFARAGLLLLSIKGS